MVGSTHVRDHTTHNRKKKSRCTARLSSASSCSVAVAGQRQSSLFSASRSFWRRAGSARSLVSASRAVPWRRRVHREAQQARRSPRRTCSHPHKAIRSSMPTETVIRQKVGHRDRCRHANPFVRGGERRSDRSDREQNFIPSQCWPRRKLFRPFVAGSQPGGAELERP